VSGYHIIQFNTISHHTIPNIDPMVWFLYLIECKGGSIYTGITTDVPARYAAHQCGKGARYTRAFPPRKLLMAIEYPDRSSASKAEYATKRLTASQKRQLVSVDPSTG